MSISKDVNKFGRKRTIPDPIQREIRQKSGFGCVICGQAVTHYDHVDPEWNEAKEHNPRGMTQLCGSCHDRKTRGLLSVETIRSAMKNPKCLKNGYAISPFDIGCKWPKIILGGNVHENTKELIVINGLSILSIEQDTEDSPVLLNINFFDENEEKFFWTNKSNEWHVRSDLWDSEINGQLLKVRFKPRGFLLKLKFNPPNQIYVDELKMNYKGIRLRADKNGLRFLNKDKKSIYSSDSGLHINHCARAYDFTIDGSDNIKYGFLGAMKACLHSN
ncbi:MAG: HNH endonuclease [Gammaproteobacteria bacterium]|nr:HNH endonuclease [Gammaproteobacteria bacterium]